MQQMSVSKNNGTPKSWILIGFSIMNHPFLGKTPYFWKHPNGFGMGCDEVLSKVTALGICMSKSSQIALRPAQSVVQWKLTEEKNGNNTHHL